MSTSTRTTKPSEVSHERTTFDEIASRVIDFTSRGRFLLVVAGALLAWFVIGLLTGFVGEWLEAGAAAMAGVTLILVFAVENANRRRDQALQRKLNAIAEAMAEKMGDSEHADELRQAVGLEHRESVD